MYNLKIIKCKNRVEIYKIYNYIVRDRATKDNKNNKNNKDNKVISSNKTKTQNRIDNLNLTRNKIVRLIKCNKDLTTFLTLTFATEQDYKQSKLLLKTLFNKLKRHYTELKYLWVLEFGDKNNRLHYHVLCNISINIKLSTSRQYKSKKHKKLESDFKDKYWKHGFVDIRSLQTEGNTNIALYVSSYIVKSLQDTNLQGYRVFGYSNKTLDKPVTSTTIDSRDLETILAEYITQDYKIKYSNNYLIGYTKDGVEHKGNVTYLDIDLEVENEN